MSIYFNIVIEGNNYRIEESRVKQCSAADTLSRINEIFQKKWVCLTSEDGSRLKALADTIQERFQRKLNRFKIFGRCLPQLVQSLMGQGASIGLVQVLYQQIVTTYQVGRNLSVLSDELKLQIMGCLGPKDLGRVACVGRDTSRLVLDKVFKTDFVTQAQEFGYLGDDPKAARLFMSSLYRDIQILVKGEHRYLSSRFRYDDYTQPWLLDKKYIAYKLSRDGSRVFDFEATLRNMKSMPALEIFQILFYQHKRVDWNSGQWNYNSAFAQFLIAIQKKQNKVMEHHALRVLNCELNTAVSGYRESNSTHYELLIRLGAYIPSMLAKALDTNCLPIIKACVECAQDLDKNDVLRAAAGSGKVDIIRYLLEQGAEVDSEDSSGATPLFHAAMAGHTAVCGLLLDKGADVNAEHETGYTPLHAASKNGHVGVVKLLLDRGADVQSHDTVVGTPLHLATNKDVMQVLLAHATDLETTDRFGRTPLRCFIQSGHLGVARLLLKKGADANTFNHIGETVLFDAILKNEDSVRLLLEFGARIDSNRNGETPLQRALRKNVNPRIVEALILAEKEALKKEMERLRLKAQQDADYNQSLIADQQKEIDRLKGQLEGKIKKDS